MNDVATPARLVDVASDALRLLTFRLTREEFLAFGNRHLAFGLLATWIVGIGRYWDHPKAVLAQHLGLGSLAYALTLSLFVYLLTRPLGPKDWTYVRVLTFVTLVSPPAILYAIPVEMIFDMHTARLANVAFLAIVAVWRVALFAWFLRRMGGLSRGRVFIAVQLPIALIIVALAWLNLSHAVFNIMTGVSHPRSPGATPDDIAYSVVFGTGVWAMLASPVLILMYVVAALSARDKD